MANSGSSAQFHRAGNLMVPREHWFHQRLNVGGEQIDYKGDYPRIRRMFEVEADKRGTVSQMSGVCKAVGLKPRLRNGFIYLKAADAAANQSLLAALEYLPAHVGDFV